MPASQAEKDSISIGVIISDGVCNWVGHIARAMNRDNIMLSRHSRVEIKWVRCNERPIMLIIKAEW